MNSKKRYFHVRVSKRDTDALREPGDRHPIGTATRTIEQAVVLRKRIDRLQEKWQTPKDARYPVTLVLHRVLAHLESDEMAIVHRGGDVASRLAKYTGLPANAPALTLVVSASLMSTYNPVKRFIHRRRNRKGGTS